MTSPKIDIRTHLAALMETADSYRLACDRFDTSLEEARERLNAEMNAVVEAVAQCRAAGLEVGEPFDNSDPVTRAFNTIKFMRHPIILSCQL